MPSQEKYFQCMNASPAEMDLLWANGWRHFGTLFFRYQFANYRSSWCQVMPLRIELANFSLSRSQKRILNKNRDTEVIIKDTLIDAEKQHLFHRHKKRFKENVPGSLYNFLSSTPATIPCHNQEILVFLQGKLLACSFLDIGATATSAVYAMFEPTEIKRSLGIYTMLTAINYSQQLGCRYYYPGYAYHESSFYDYKKKFTGLEYFNWQQGWQPFPYDQQPITNESE